MIKNFKALKNRSVHTMAEISIKKFTPRHTHTHTHTHTHLTRNYIRGHIYQDFIIRTHYYIVFYVLLTVHPCIIFFKWSQLDAHYFLVYLFQLLYMFRATMCPSSRELIVSMRHFYFSSCMGGCLVCWLGWDSCLIPTSRPERKVPVSHRYNKFSWWWSHSCPKHVEKL